MENNNREKILKVVKDYHDKTDGKCGLGFPRLIREVGINTEEVKIILNELHASNQIHVRKGLNDKLIMYGSKKKR